MAGGGSGDGLEGESAAVVRLSEQVASLTRELTRRLDELRGEVEALEREVMGPPRKESVRGRLHDLESDAASARYAAAALERAKTERRYRLSVFEWAMGPLIGVAATVAAAAILHALGIA